MGLCHLFVLRADPVSTHNSLLPKASKLELGTILIKTGQLVANRMIPRIWPKTQILKVNLQSPHKFSVQLSERARFHSFPALTTFFASSTEKKGCADEAFAAPPFAHFRIMRVFAGGPVVPCP